MICQKKGKLIFIELVVQGVLEEKVKFLIKGVAINLVMP
jgi:hypothetical protein